MVRERFTDTPFGQPFLASDCDYARSQRRCTPAQRLLILTVTAQAKSPWASIASAKGAAFDYDSVRSGHVPPKPNRCSIRGWRAL